MRIAYYNRLLREPWGCGVHARGLVKAWVDQGHEVLCLPESLGSLAGSHGRLGLETRWAPVAVKHVALDARNRIRAHHVLQDLLGRIAAFAPDVLVARRVLYDYLLDGLSVQLGGIPLVAEVNAVLSMETPTIGGQRLLPWESARERDFLLRSGAAACVTEEARQQVLLLGYPSERARVVPNGVDTALFTPDVPCAQHVAEWKGNAFVVGFAGTFAPTHDTSTLLAAMQSLVSSRCDVKFLFVGPSPGYALDQRWLPAPQGRMLVTGQIAHHLVPSALVAADVLWAAFRNDYGSPLKLFEYMAMERAVAICGEGQAAELVNRARCGIAVERFDSRGLFDAVESLLSSSAVREASAARGRNWVRRHGTWDRAARRVAALAEIARG